MKHSKRFHRSTTVLAVVALGILSLAGQSSLGTAQHPPGPSTPADRAALFDYLLEKTFERESFSPIKNERLELDIEAGMRAYRDELIAADTDEKLFYALVKLGNARKDRHLSLNPIEGGIVLDHWRPLDNLEVFIQAPIRFATDYGTPGDFFVFVADFAENVGDYVGPEGINPGDRLLAVNDRPFGEYVDAIEPYIRYSTLEGFWWKMAEGIPEKHYDVSPDFYRDDITFRLGRADGSQYDVTLPYLDPESIAWSGHGARLYPGFHLVSDRHTFDLWVHDTKPVLLLDWYGFRELLVEDMDWLVDYAEDNGMLDSAVIFDATRCRGGSRGAYAIQRLSPKPFKTTFGNLRLSDITEDFVREKRADYDASRITDSGVAETIDDGSWLIDWLENDVMAGLRDGQEYSNDVPFKLAHAPKYSDGVIQPAPVHFRGPLVCLFGPHGGSHLDQFAAIVVDNQLGHTIGMPTGGYSNTWEWEEELVFPISGKPIAGYMWSIGHTVRPNGRIVEGLAADVDDYVPLTRENYLEYHRLLLERTFRHLGLD